MTMPNNVIDNPVAPRYTHLDHPSVQNFTCIHVQDGEFEGLVYHYENLKIGAPDDEGALLTFNYHIVEGSTPEDPEVKRRMEDVIASIIYHILSDSVGKIGSDENRTDNPEEPGAQRGLRTEDPAVS